MTTLQTTTTLFLLDVQDLTAGVLAAMEEGIPLPLDRERVQALQGRVEEVLEQSWGDA